MRINQNIKNTVMPQYARQLIKQNVSFPIRQDVVYSRQTVDKVNVRAMKNEFDGTKITIESEIDIDNRHIHRLHNDTIGQIAFACAVGNIKSILVERLVKLFQTFSRF